MQSGTTSLFDLLSHHKGPPLRLDKTNLSKSISHHLVRSDDSHCLPPHVHHWRIPVHVAVPIFGANKAAGVGHPIQHTFSKVSNFLLFLFQLQHPGRNKQPSPTSQPHATIVDGPPIESTTIQPPFKWPTQSIGHHVARRPSRRSVLIMAMNRLRRLLHLQYTVWQPHGLLRASMPLRRLASEGPTCT